MLRRSSIFVIAILIFQSFILHAKTESLEDSCSIKVTLLGTTFSANGTLDPSDDIFFRNTPYSKDRRIGLLDRQSGVNRSLRSRR